MNEKAAGGILGGVALLAALFLFARFGWSFGGLLKSVLLLGAFVLALLLLLVGVVMFFALRKPKKGAAPAPSPAAAAGLTPEQAALLQKGRGNLLKLRSMSLRVKNAGIRQQCGQICTAAERILKTLRETPERIPAARQFFNYYLPVLGEILTKYERLERSGVPIEEMTQKVSAYLTQIEQAMQRQHESLFDADLLDMTVEMETMTMACRRDGLLSGQQFQVESGGETITLTL